MATPCLALQNWFPGLTLRGAEHWTAEHTFILSSEVRVGGEGIHLYKGMNTFYVLKM